MSTRKPRPRADLPRPLVEALQAKATAQGTNASHLFHHWVLQAAQLVLAGQGSALPQEKRATRGSLGGDVVEVRWLQGLDEYARCRDLIAGAGSSVPAVLRTAGRRYLAEGVDAVSMRWPAKGAMKVPA